MNDANGVAVTQATSRKYNLHTLSDLAKVANQLTFAAVPACRVRPDCLVGMKNTYGINFKDIKYVDSAPIRYKGIQDGTYDAVQVFTTDGPIKALNLVVLRDDKGIFPAYHVAPVVRSTILQKYPRLALILNRLAPYLTTQAMINLNLQVVVQGKDHMVAARSFLRSKHLL
jgi:osmoprotectant transport system permease protein